MPEQPNRILGIDPGLNITGYAVIESRGKRVRLCEAGVVRGTAGSSLVRRVAEIHKGVAEVIAELRPTAMAVEELYSHYDRPRTAILMGHARGVICLAAAQAGIPVVNYAATQIKKNSHRIGPRFKSPSAKGHPARTGIRSPTRPAGCGRCTGNCRLSSLS